MKVEELMIGDIITLKDSVEIDETPIPVKVIALGYQHHGNENEALVQIGDDETCDIVTIDDDFVGYPITAEILEKNGFGYVEEDNLMGYTHFYLGEPYYCKNMDLHIGGNKDGLFWMNYLRNDIGSLRYVHELQHALRICGIEKEINVN